MHQRSAGFFFNFQLQHCHSEPGRISDGDEESAFAFCARAASTVRPRS